ncbi:MAG: DUF4136 domain-containing protein [Terrimicrobiaceae bacterium]|nr:DUF4136 domain-containing protein [Terrimicrobiaceae bacterium]
MKRALCSLAALILISGCATFSRPHIGIAYDKGDLERVEKARTYRWSLPAPKEINPYNNQSLYLGLVQSEVDTQLAKKGYKPAPGKGGTADLLISYLVMYQNDGTTTTVDKFFGTNRIPEALIVATGRGPSLKYETGTLVIDASDARDHESLWRGAISSVVDRSKPFEAQKKRIDKAVALVMKDFPAAK